VFCTKPETSKIKLLADANRCHSVVVKQFLVQTLGGIDSCRVMVHE